MNAHTLPPGKYFIGDPSLVFDSSWDDVLQLTDFFGLSGPVMIKGLPIWGAGTATGNGTFLDQNGAEYEIDDGLLAAVPIELIEDPNGEEHGTMLDAPHGLDVCFDKGVFRFNAICIDTNENDLDEVIDGGYDLDTEDDKFI